MLAGLLSLRSFPFRNRKNDGDSLLGTSTTVQNGPRYGTVRVQVRILLRQPRPPCPPSWASGDTKRNVKREKAHDPWEAPQGVGQTPTAQTGREDFQPPRGPLPRRPGAEGKQPTA